MRVVIIGGGIAGLATAASIAKSDAAECVILERELTSSELGAGIQITANGSRVLRYLDVLDAAEPYAVRSRGTSYRDIVTGEPLFERDLPEAADDVPYLQIHRVGLRSALVEKVDPSAIAWGAECVAVHDDGERTTVETADGRVFHGDVVLGADGLNSEVRALTFGRERPTFSGVVAWRALIPRAAVEHVGLDLRQHTWWGPDRTVVAYWVDGGERLNFVGLVPEAEAKVESWETRGALEVFRGSFEGVCPELAQVIEVIDDVFTTGIYDRPDVMEFVRGRIGLVGDAAHPVEPGLANGGSLALEDAVTVSRCLERHGPGGVATALLEYQARRSARAAKVQKIAREWGAQGRLSDAEAIKHRNQALQRLGGYRDWLWNFDAVAAAERPLGGVDNDAVLGV